MDENKEIADAAAAISRRRSAPSTEAQKILETKRATQTSGGSRRLVTPEPVVPMKTQTTSGKLQILRPRRASVTIRA